jgi:hypothetical protein
VRVALALAALALSGCLSFAGDKLPKRPVDSLPMSKVTDADYTLAVHFDEENQPNLVPIYSIILETPMKRVFAHAHRGEGDAPLHLDVVLGSKPMTVGNQIWLLCSELTAYIVPVHREVVYTLDARVDWNGKPLATYPYEDTIDRWLWLPALPLMIVNYFTAPKQLDVIQNMNANMVFDVGRDVDKLAGATAASP